MCVQYTVMIRVVSECGEATRSVRFELNELFELIHHFSIVSFSPRSLQSHSHTNIQTTLTQYIHVYILCNLITHIEKDMINNNRWFISQ